MSTAIIGVGKIGGAVATHLTAGDETVVLATQTKASAEQLARKLGDKASAAVVADAIAPAEAVIFAVWFDAVKELVEEYASALDGKVVVDPSNPIAMNDGGGFSRTLPDGVSAGSVIDHLLPPGAHFVKAFGTLAADSLATGAYRSPERAVLFYATDDDQAALVEERLISAAGFDPVKVGGVDQAIRIEMFGDLHGFGGPEREDGQRRGGARLACALAAVAGDDKYREEGGRSHDFSFDGSDRS
jgi:8-hydroxy-5-deazaflavin:NADPH oxidoreductase